MEVKLIRLTHKIATQLQLVAESCTICSPRARRPVRKLLDTLSHARRNLRRPYYEGTRAVGLKNPVNADLQASCINFTTFNSNVRVQSILEHYIYRMITNDVSDYIHLLVRIAHIICNHTFLCDCAFFIYGRHKSTATKLLSHSFTNFRVRKCLSLYFVKQAYSTH
jgi:hypothetical protein